ncbi:MAG TPA: hypothetical protein DCE44_18075 [Verrucomicrobiales bacterium]|nr:hypothetical protein [Verrucomicrobiales bacterium]
MVVFIVWRPIFSRLAAHIKQRLRTAPRVRLLPPDPLMEGQQIRGDGAGDEAGRSDEQPAAARPETAVRLFGQPTWRLGNRASDICQLKSSEA